VVHNVAVRKGRRFLIFVGTALVIVGSILIILPIVAKSLNYHNASNYTRQMETVIKIPSAKEYEACDYTKMPVAATVTYTDEQLEQAQLDQSLFDELLGLGDALTWEQQDLSDSPTDMQANTYILAIPSIDLEISAIRCETFSSIYHTMRLGAAIFPKAPEPNEIGNICVSAHRTGSRDYFHDLDQLSIGDELYLYTAELGSYKYEVVKVGVIAANDWSVAGQTDYPVITLISCQAYQGVSHGRRIMVRAKLVAVAAP